MIQIRPADERGRTRTGWLDSRHTFSFGDYADPANMGFRALRVINEDWIAPGGGFGTHPHRDMEILTVVLEGALAHRDSTGGAGELRPGEVQQMSAGTGIRHSEYNASDREAVHLLQIWLLPERAGVQPSYDQRPFPAEGRRGRLQLLASRDGRDGALPIHQDAELYTTGLRPGETVTHALRPGRHAWVQVARGSVELNGQPLRSGDGAAVSEETSLALSAHEPAEVLVFDLA
jgi:quercetin 2,3-dioxygenase